MDQISHLSKPIFADRIGGENFGNSKNVYKFEQIKESKRRFIAKNPSIPIIDMGVGEPDCATDKSIIDALTKYSAIPENHKYADNGCQEFLQSAANYMRRNFSVELDPHTEIMHSIGSKAALSILPSCFVNPGDIVITTTPGYGVFATHSQFLGGEVIALPLTHSNNFLPDFSTISTDILNKTKVVVLNYPNNPTGACATKEFFGKIINLAKKFGFIVIHDAAYADLFFDPSERLSILNIAGAKDVALELHSLSKPYNMTGWRIGWVCGNSDLVKAYSHVKSHSDSGQFLPIQKASAEALDNAKIPAENGKKYNARAKRIIEILQKFGFTLNPLKAGFFLYAKSPKEIIFNNETVVFSSANEFSTWLLETFGIVTVPWDDAGSYIRLSMTFANEEHVFQELPERLQKVKFKW